MKDKYKKALKGIMGDIKKNYPEIAIDHLKEELKDKGITIDRLYKSGHEDIKKQLEKFKEEIKQTKEYDATKIIEEDKEVILDNVIFSFDSNIHLTSDKYFNYSKGILEEKDYGLSDNISQIIKKYGKENIITFTTFFRELERDTHYGGFRPHKWGEYIGEYEEVRNNEYFSETDIPYLIVYTVYKIRGEKE